MKSRATRTLRGSATSAISWDQSAATTTRLPHSLSTRSRDKGGPDECQGKCDQRTPHLCHSLPVARTAPPRRHGDREATRDPWMRGRELSGRSCQQADRIHVLSGSCGA
jgi:hypothetical protein